MNAADSAWQRRMNKMLAADVSAAEKILIEHGLSAKQALAYVEQATPSGVIDFRSGAPAMLRDPAHAACYALRMLLLARFIPATDAHALQLGRLWGRASVGMNFPEIARSTQKWWLDAHRGSGGRKENDLTRTLRTILEQKPNADANYVLQYLNSDEALDKFHCTDNPTIHITEIEVDEETGTLKYDDRSRRTYKILFESLERKIRRLRSGKRSHTTTAAGRLKKIRPDWLKSEIRRHRPG